MQRLLLVMVISWLVVLPAQAATALSSGQTGYGEFTTMYESTLPLAGWSVTHDSFDRLTTGESYRLRVYEASLLGVPILDQTIYGVEGEGLSAALWSDADQQGHFLDLQGAFRIDMLSGTLGVDDVRFVTEIAGIDYLASLSQLTVVPEPSFGWAHLALLAMMLSRRSRSRTRHCWQPPPFLSLTHAHSNSTPLRALDAAPGRGRQS
jgi:hypothetical protein